MKRFFSVLLTVCLVLSMLTVYASAVSAASDKLTVAASSAEATAGTDAAITLSLKENPGFAYLKLEVSYNGAAMKLQSAVSTNLPDNGASFIASPDIDKNPYVMLWSGSSDTKATGNLVKLTFAVSPQASGSYDVTVRIADSNDQDGNKVAVHAAAKGTVKVKGNPKATTANRTTAATETAATTPSIPGSAPMPPAPTIAADEPDRTSTLPTDEPAVTEPSDTSETASTVWNILDTYDDEDGLPVYIKDAFVTTPLGMAPALPDVVDVVYESGRENPFDVIWQTIDPEQYAQEGQFLVEGSVDGLNSTALCHVTVGDTIVIRYETVNASVTAGRLPQLPDEVKAYFSDGTERYVPVKWLVWNPSAFVSPGTKTEIRGMALDANAIVFPHFRGAAIPAATVTVTAPAVVSIEDAAVTTEEGTAPALPQTVVAHFSNGTANVVPVEWDDIDPAWYAQAGCFTIQGGLSGTAVTAICEVTVVQAGETSPSDLPYEEAISPTDRLLPVA